MIRWLSAFLACAALAAGARAQAPDYVQIIEQVGPSVVNVVIERPPLSPKERAAKAPDDETARFFERFADKKPRPELIRGSGFIISPDGYIVTASYNLHADERVTIKVTLTDGRQFSAKRVGVDDKTDIALLKIEATGLRAVKFGDASRLKVGQRVLLLGSAIAGENTVADGIISQSSAPRNISAMQSSVPAIPLLATTVPVQAGNGGAPFVDARGEVIGLVTQMYVHRNAPFATISFGVLPDVIRSVADSLRTVGYVPRGAIRVVVAEVTKEFADSLGMPAPRGALVTETQRGGPADRAGIAAGDVILQFNGQPVEHSLDITSMVSGAKAGSRVPVQVLRKGVLLNVVVEIEDASRGAPPKTR